MKRILIILFLLFDSSAVYAALPSDDERQEAINDALTNAETSLDHSPAEIQNQPTVHRRMFDLAFQTESFRYKTGDQWPYNYSQLYPVSNQIKKDGTVNGIYGSTTWTGPLHTWSDLWSKEEVPNFAKLEIDASKGSSDYSSYVTGKLKGLDAWNLDTRFLLGYDYIFNKTTDYTPYIGIGYQRFSDRDGGWVDFIIEDYAQYTTISSMFYLPIGVETHTALDNQWDMDIKLEGDIVVYGTVDYHLNDISGSYQAIALSTGDQITVSPLAATSNLNGGYGFRTSLKLIKKFKYCDFYIEPFFKFLYLNKSQEVQEAFSSTNGGTYVSANQNGTPYKALWNAKNTTVDIGARAGVQF